MLIFGISFDGILNKKAIFNQDLNQKCHDLFYRIWKFVAHNPYYNPDKSSHIRQQISNIWLLDDDIDEPESNFPESHLIKRLNKYLPYNVA